MNSTNSSTISTVNAYLTRQRENLFAQRKEPLQALFDTSLFNVDKCLQLLNSHQDLADLKKQRHSYLTELKRLESKRTKLLKTVENLKSDYDSLLAKTNSLVERNFQVKHKLVHNTLNLNELNTALNNRIHSIPPLNMLAMFNNSLLTQLESPRFAACSLEMCLDMSKCPPNEKLAVYIYRTYHDMPKSVLELILSFDFKRLELSVNVIRKVERIEQACLVIIFVSKQASDYYKQKLSKFIESNKQRNFLFVNVEWLDGNSNTGLHDYLSTVIKSQLSQVLAHKSFYASYRKHHKNPFNLHYSIIFNSTQSRQYKQPSIKKRPFLISYHYSPVKLLSLSNTNLQLVNKSLIANDRVLFDLNCSTTGIESLCFNETERAAKLAQSEFTLIIPSLNNMNADLTLRLVEALQCSTIPVLIDLDVSLPLHGLVEWQDIIVRLPFSSIHRVVSILESIDKSDVASRQVKARNVYNAYFSSHTSQLLTLIAFVQHRLSLKPTSMQNAVFSEANVSSVKSSSNFSNYSEDNADEGIASQDLEYLGATNQRPVNSADYTRNYTQNTFTAWNVYYHPFNSFPSTPFDHQLANNAFASEHSHDVLERTVDGLANITIGGGDGRLFHNGLGGNYKNEQFTIIILSYKRERILIDLLDRYLKLPYLNSIIVVWNALDTEISHVRFYFIRFQTILMGNDKKYGQILKHYIF
jgi:hypothetical protein